MVDKTKKISYNRDVDSNIHTRTGLHIGQVNTYGKVVAHLQYNDLVARYAASSMGNKPCAIALKVHRHGQSELPVDFKVGRLSSYFFLEVCCVHKKG